MILSKAWYCYLIYFLLLLLLKCFCNAVSLFYGHENKVHCCCCCCCCMNWSHGTGPNTLDRKSGKTSKMNGLQPVKLSVSSSVSDFCMWLVHAKGPFAYVCSRCKILTVLSDSRFPRTSPRPYETTLTTVALCRYSNTKMKITWYRPRIALTCDDIRLAKITTKPRFDNAKCKFYHETNPKAVKMKTIPTWERHEGNESLRKCHANEAWWGILRMWPNRAYRA